MDFSTWHPVSLTDLATIIGLFFSGFGLLLNALERRAGNLLEITKQHRELWVWIRTDPNSKRLFDAHADVVNNPVTDDERRSVNFVILHFFANFQAAKTGFYKLPERIVLDIRSFFSRPIPEAAWNLSKQFHEVDFVRFVERELHRK
jgi:hypothetical protein